MQPWIRQGRAGGGPADSPLVSCHAYCGGCHWHWQQSRDSFPGQPVVLVHGLATSSKAFAPMAEAVAGWAPVLVPDLPGFGASRGDPGDLGVAGLAAVLAEWMGMAGAPEAHLVASSFGSQIAAELAVRYPHRIHSLTLVGPTLDPAARNIPAQAFRFFEALTREPLSLVSEHFRGGVHRQHRVLRALLRDRIEAKLPHVKAPALVLRGSLDPIAPESWIRHAARLLPQAVANTLPGGAHCVPMTHPKLVAQAVRKFTFRYRHGIEN